MTNSISCFNVVSIMKRHVKYFKISKAYVDKNVSLLHSKLGSYILFQANFAYVLYLRNNLLYMYVFDLFF